MAGHRKLFLFASIIFSIVILGISFSAGCAFTEKSGGRSVQPECYTQLMLGDLSPSVVREGDAGLNVTIHQDFARSGYPLRIDVEITNNSDGYLPESPGQLWLEVWATDPLGRTFPIPVYPKGFEGEEYTISDPGALAYLDIGEVMELDGFYGLERDGGIASGARIFRSPVIAPDGEMTMCEDYPSAMAPVDYRIGPGQTDVETYVWNVIDGFSYGRLTLTETLYFRPLPLSIGEFFELPDSEYAPVVVASQTQFMDIVDWGN